MDLIFRNMAKMMLPSVPIFNFLDLSDGKDTELVKVSYASQPPASNHGGCGMHTWIGAMAEARWVLPCVWKIVRVFGTLWAIWYSDKDRPSGLCRNPSFKHRMKRSLLTGEHSNIFYLSIVYYITFHIY